MRVIPRRNKGRRQDEDPAGTASPQGPPGDTATSETPPPADPAQQSPPSPGLMTPPTKEPPSRTSPPATAPTPPAQANASEPAPGKPTPGESATGEPAAGEVTRPMGGARGPDADPARALGQESLRTAAARTASAGGTPAGGARGTTVTLPVDAEPDAARRRRARAAERQRVAAEVKRSRAARRQGLAYREIGPAAGAADQHRSALLVMVVTLGLLIAAVAVTGGMIASSRRTRPVTLASPLHIYPVTATTPGQCPAGTQGITGQSGSGPTCYRLAQGIAIRKVADLRVQESRVRPGGYDVALTLRPVDRDAFADLTRATVGRDLAFVVRNRLVTLPRVDMAILDGKVVVTGPPDRASADRLVRELKGR